MDQQKYFIERLKNILMHYEKQSVTIQPPQSKHTNTGIPKK